MAYARPFDIGYLYSSVEAYKNDLASIEYLSAEIDRLREEIRADMDGNVPENVLEEKMNTFVALVRQRSVLYGTVAQAEKDLKTGIEMLSRLENVHLPDGRHIKVVERSDMLHAQVYVLDGSNKVLDTLVLEMVSSPEEVRRIQGVVNDLHARLVEVAKEDVYDVDEPAWEAKKSAEADVVRLERADASLDRFARFKEFVADLNAKLAPFVGRAKEMVQAFAGRLRESFTALRTYVNEWGQYHIGEYRSMRKSFSALDELEDFYMEFEDDIRRAEEVLLRTRQDLADAYRKRDGLMLGGFRLANVFMNKTKRLDKLEAEIAELHEEHEKVKKQLEELKDHVKMARNVKLEKLFADAANISNKNVGPYTVEVRSGRDEKCVSIFCRGKKIDEIRFPDRDSRPMDEQIADLKRFNKTIKSLSPRSVDDRSQNQAKVDPELERYVQNRKEMYMAKIRDLVSEMETITDPALAREKTRELIESVQQYASYINCACDVYMDNTGHLNLDFVDQDMNHLSETIMAKVSPQIGREIMDVAFHMSRTHEDTYSVDQSKEFELAVGLYSRQYEKMAAEYIRAHDTEGLKRLNQTLSDRMMALGPMTVGNAQVSISRFGDGFKLTIDHADGRREIVVCPVGLDGKIDMEHLSGLVKRMQEKSHGNVYDRLRELDKSRTPIREKEEERTRDIYETLEKMQSPEEERQIEDREVERI